MLNEDTYYISLKLISPPYENPKTYLIINDIASFETIFDHSNTSVKGNFKNKWGGVVAPRLVWTD